MIPICPNNATKFSMTKAPLMGRTLLGWHLTIFDSYQTAKTGPAIA
jgi:hypothetical protein